MADRSTERALALLGALRLEDGRTWGEAATPVQRADAASILDADARARFHYITRARGYSKTTDLAAVVIAAMLEQAPAGARLFAAASDRDQSRLLVDSIDGFVRRTPLLRGLLDVQSFRVVSARGGAELTALAADEAGAWGLRPYLVVADELGAWNPTPGTQRFWEALATAIPKTRGRLAVITTAGTPRSWAHRLLEHAKASELWRVSETAGPPPWLDADMLEEERRRLPESSFRRLFLNEWAQAEDKLVSLSDLAACTVLEGPLAAVPGTRYRVAADLGLKGDRTACVVCHAEALTRTLEPADFEDGEQPLMRAAGEPHELTVGTRVVLDRIETWQGTREAPVRVAEVEEWLAQASHSFNGAPVTLDPWQALGTLQRLQARGVRVDEFTFNPASVGRLASTLHLLLRNRALALPDDPELIDELAAVELRETSPGVMRMDHAAGAHDDRAIALGMAAIRLLERPQFGRVTLGPSLYDH